MVFVYFPGAPTVCVCVCEWTCVRLTPFSEELGEEEDQSAVKYTQHGRSKGFSKTNRPITKIKKGGAMFFC